MILFLLMAVAAAAQLTLELEAREMVVGQTVSLTLQLVNGDLRGKPVVPVGAGLAVRFTGRSTQRVVVNFRTTNIVRYSYELRATQPGEWAIGPVDLQQGQDTFHAEPITVQVGEPPTLHGDAPVLATLSDPSPVLGQVVVYRFQFRHDKPLVDAGWTQPAFDGFVEEQIAESTQREYQVEDKGKAFSITTIEVPLVAAGLGARTVPPAVLTAKYRTAGRRRSRGRRIDELFGDSPFASLGNVRTMTHSTEPLPVEIRALPGGAPVDFSGLVGQFTVQVRSDVKRLALGESATLEYRITGDGTLSGFRLPTPPGDVAFRVYDDAPEVKASVRDGRFVASVLVRRAVVPESEGVTTVPPIRITVFDPEREVFDEVIAPAVVLHVDPGEPGAGVVESYATDGSGAQRAVTSLGEDILPVSSPDRVGDATLQGSLPVILALPAAPLLAWFGVLGLGSWRSRRVDPVALLKSRMRSIPAEPASRLAALESVFLDAAGLSLGRPAPGLDREAVASLGADAVALYDALVQARYGGVDAELSTLHDRVQRFVETI